MGLALRRYAEFLRDSVPGTQTVTPAVSVDDLAAELRWVAEVIRSGRVDHVDAVQRARLAAACEAVAAVLLGATHAHQVA